MIENKNIFDLFQNNLKVRYRSCLEFFSLINGRCMSQGVTTRSTISSKKNKN